MGTKLLKNVILTSTRVRAKISITNTVLCVRYSHNTRVSDNDVNLANTNIRKQTDLWENATSSLEDDYISIAIAEKKYSYPSIWLRDNCTCEKCFHPSSQSRIINWCEFDINVTPVSVVTTGNTLVIKWSDGHDSQYDFKWLIERSFNSKDQETYLNNFYRPQKIVWSAKDSVELFKNYPYKDVVQNDKCLKDWLHRLSVYGVAFLDEVPASVESNKKLAERIGFIRRTHYGDDYEIKADPKGQANNVAYLSHNLQLHSDLPYYEYKPGVTLLHYIEQAKGSGAENILTDTHFIIRILKESNPEYYKILTEIPVDWTDIGQQDGNKFYSIYRSPVIVEDSEGNIIRINHSIPQRGSHFNVRIDKVKLWYRALHKLIELLYKHGCYFKPSPNTILAFDNIRLVHGRTKYEDTSDNSRFLIGCYIDWDEIYSRLRCLMKPF